VKQECRVYTFIYKENSMMKWQQGLAVVLFAVVGVQASVISDSFNGTSIDTTTWTTSGNVGIYNATLFARTGGYVRSISTVSTQSGSDIVVTFKDVGTSTSAYNQEMGLYSADGSQYIKFDEEGQNNTVLKIKGANGVESQYVIWGSGVAARTPYGPELRCPSQCITWQLTLNQDSLALYINDKWSGIDHIVTKTFTNLQVLTSADTTGSSGTILLPTADLGVEFHGNSSNIKFFVSEITLVPEPGMISLMGLSLIGWLRRKR
jgi:hypothetical protein